jgi:MFS family permease
VGALAGAVIVTSLGDVRHKGIWIVGSILAYAVCLVALAATPWFILAWIVVAALGFTDALQSVPRNAVIQLMTPDELRGRISAFQGMIVNAGPGLGLGAMGAAAGAVGAPIALISGAVLCAVANIAILINRRELRARDLAMDTEPEPTTRRR